MKMVINGEWTGSLSYRTSSLKYPANGEAGMITTNDEHLAEKIQKFRSHGMTARTWNQHRGRALSRIPEVTIPFIGARGRSSYHIFSELLSEQVNLENFIVHMQAHGIQTSVHYTLVHIFTHYPEWFGGIDGPLLNAEYAGEHGVALPQYTQITAQEINTVATAMETPSKQWQKKWKNT